MSNSHFNQDDPRLTAFVMGELDETERETFQSHMEQCPQCADLVKELQEFSSLLMLTMKSEPTLKLPESSHDKIELALAAPGDVIIKTEDRSGKTNRSAISWMMTSASISVASLVILISWFTLTKSSYSPQSKLTVISATNGVLNPTDKNRAYQLGLEIDHLNFGEKKKSSPNSVTGTTETLLKNPKIALNDKIEVIVNGNNSNQPIASNTADPIVLQPGNTIALIPEQLTKRGPTDFYVEEAPTVVDKGYIDSNKTNKKQIRHTTTGVGVNDAGPLGVFSKPVRSRAKQEVSTNSNLGRNIVVTPPSSAAGNSYKNYSRPSSRWLYYQTENNRDYVTNDRYNLYHNKEGILDRKELARINSTQLFGRESRIKPQNSYGVIVDNKFCSPSKEPLSTFSIDVDTASYTILRKHLEKELLPPPNAIRIEELVNYFTYDDTPPEKNDQPFACHMETGACPWENNHKLVRIGIKGKEIPVKKRPPCNLVFLIDVSGSMKDSDKLPLVKSGLEILTRNLSKQDHISIVTYAGQAGLRLPPTDGSQQNKILDQIHALNADGSTNGEAGLLLAYKQARINHDSERISRVILCTDGDFNVGMSDDDEMVTLIKKEASEGNIFLSVMGFGMGNLQDSKLEKLADNGNGNYAYIDNRREANKVFHEEINETLVTIAKDVKIQVEFNPTTIDSYRLIGYANRIMKHQDFNDDTKDAGDIGAGHHVTVLYEVVPQGVTRKKSIDDLKYQEKTRQPKPKANGSKEFLTCKIRYKLPDGKKSSKLEYALNPEETEASTLSKDFYWASAVSSFGMLLRNSPYKGMTSFDLVLELAEKGRGEDPTGRRLELIDLVRKTQHKLARQRNITQEEVK